MSPVYASYSQSMQNPYLLRNQLLQGQAQQSLAAGQSAQQSAAAQEWKNQLLQELFSGGANPSMFRSSGATSAEYEKAKRMRAGQFGRLWDLLGQRTQTGMGMWEGYGQQQAKDIAQSYAARGGSIMQQLHSSGLGGSTVAPSMMLGNEREKQDALARLGEQITSQKFGAYSQLTGDQATAIQHYMQLEAQAAPTWSDVAQAARSGSDMWLRLLEMIE